MSVDHDIFVELEEFYSPPAGEFSEVNVPELGYLMIDGRGGLSSTEYRDAAQALYAVADRLRDVVQERIGRSFAMAPLETLWAAVELAVPHHGDRELWSWTAMIAQPDWVDAVLVQDAVERVRLAEPLPALERIRFELFAEGRCMQLLSAGGAEDGAALVSRLHGEILPARGLAAIGRHHEIYLSDPRETAPDELRTIIRQPVRASGVLSVPTAPASRRRLSDPFATPVEHDAFGSMRIDIALAAAHR